MKSNGNYKPQFRKSGNAIVDLKHESMCFD